LGLTTVVHGYSPEVLRLISKPKMRLPTGSNLHAVNGCLGLQAAVTTVSETCPFEIREASLSTPRVMAIRPV